MTEQQRNRPFDASNAERDADEDAFDSDRATGWSGVTDALDDSANRPAGPDYGDSPLEDEAPGSQGEIESGSEGDFGRDDEPRL